jgi:hypothetical protein
MFIQIADAQCHGFAEPHFARNVCPALASCLNEFRGNLAAILENVDDEAEAFGKASLQSCVAEHKAQRLRQAAINELEILFEIDVIDKVEFTDARRIATAAQVFQQKGVVEFLRLQFIKV